MISTGIQNSTSSENMNTAIGPNVTPTIHSISDKANEKGFHEEGSFTSDVEAPSNKNAMMSNQLTSDIPLSPDMRLHNTSNKSGDDWKGNCTRAYPEDYGSPTTVQSDPWKLCRYDAPRVTNAPPLFGTFCYNSTESLPLTPVQPRSVRTCDESRAVEWDKQYFEHDQGRVADDDAARGRLGKGLFGFDILHVESPQEEEYSGSDASVDQLLLLWELVRHGNNLQGATYEAYQGSSKDQPHFCISLSV